MAFVDPRKPSRADYVTFLREQGFSAAVLPDNSDWIDITLGIALDTVNQTINAASAYAYTVAVYNLGADRTMNLAPDQPGGTWFATQRKALDIFAFAAGLVSSSSDAGTAVSVEVIEAAKRMTLTDLQLAKTPWGRAYMGAAQAYGPTIWGLS